MNEAKFACHDGSDKTQSRSRWVPSALFRSPYSSPVLDVAPGLLSLSSFSRNPCVHSEKTEENSRWSGSSFQVTADQEKEPTAG